MSRPSIRAITTFVTSGLLVTALAAVATAADPEPGVPVLYVASTTESSIEGDVLTLADVPAVLYFSDRPERTAGHQSAADFVSDWDGAAGSFGEDPPNATLSLLSEDAVEDFVIELISADVVDGDVRFEVVALDGALPAGPTGAASLFIDLYNNYTPCINCAG